MNNFNSVGYAKIDNFLDEATTKTVAAYFKNIVHRGLCFGEDDGNVSCAHKMYADPLTEILLENMRSQVEKIVGKSLYPTYSFFRVYVKGNSLQKHVDRPSCEYSVTVNVANEGGLWPIYMQADKGPVVSFALSPGEAVVYKGCEISHWREEKESNTATGQFMLHYVAQDGDFTDYKFDRRPNLGFPKG